jgi:Tyrosine-protein kinase ephrin type A/B receptor-like
MTPDKTECLPCPASFYRLVDEMSTLPSKCVKCAPRYYRSFYSLQDTKCQYCNPAYKINDEQTDCDPEYVTPRPTSIPTGFPSCRAGQVVVPKTPENPLGCLDCSPGTYSTHPLTPCAKCQGDDDYSLAGETYCHSCGFGQKASPNKDYCVIIPTPQPTSSPTYVGRCKPGQYDNLILDKCVYCLPGTYSPNPGVACRLCPRNQYTNLSGSTSCTLCSDVVNNDRTGCIQCEASYTASITRDSDDYNNPFKYCAKCPYGKYSAKNDDCHDCQYGYKANAARTGCEPVTPSFAPTPAPALPCRPGEFLISTSPYYCEPCRPSYYQAIPNSPCIKCPAGFYTSTYGQIACSQCPGGTTVGPDQDRCV